MCSSARSIDEALILLKKQKFDAILLDIDFGEHRGAGIERLGEVIAEAPDTPVITTSGRQDYLAIRGALTRGARDYIVKQTDPEAMRLEVENAYRRILEQKRSSQNQTEIKKEAEKHPILGSSPQIQEVLTQVSRIKNSQGAVVIYGESGTGKEAIARAFRVNSKNEVLPFVAVDSATIQNHLAESLLFGHEKGAFTGANERHTGLIEQADGGILYFDELANMPISIQTKLLRVIQEKELTRLGSSRVIPVEFRVVAATNQNLEVLCKEGKFLFDLWMRLNVFELRVPTLSERKEDIPALVDFYCRKFSREKAKNFSEPALRALMNYSWPGNIRELVNAVEYACTLGDQTDILPEDLPPRITRGSPAQSHLETEQVALGFYEQVLAAEHAILNRALTLGKSMTETAALLKMDRSHFYSKLKAHGLEKPPKLSRSK